MNIHGWCPILSSKNGKGEALSKCTTNECAWWDSSKECCVVWVIHQGIQKITYDGKYDLGDIYNQIPSSN